MKKTALLASIACLLGIITYLGIELPERRAREKEINESRLYNENELGNLIGIVLPRSKLTNQKGSFFVGDLNYPADQDRLEEFFKVMSQLNVTREISSQEIEKMDISLIFSEKTSISFEFIFEKGKLLFTLGEKLKYEDSFYMMIEGNRGKKLAIVRDVSPQVNPVSEEEYRLNPKKHERLKRVLMLPEHFFYDAKVLKNFAPITHFEKAIFKNWRNREIEIDFSKKLTIPPAWPSLNYKQDFIDEFKQQIYWLRGRNVFVGADQKNLKESKGEVRLKFKNNKELKLEFFSKFGSLDGLFLMTNSEPNIVYDLPENIISILMPKLQDFWDNRIFQVKSDGGAVFSGLKDEYFSMKFGTGSVYHLLVPLSEKFQVEQVEKDHTSVPNNINFSKLFTVLYQQAFQVSTLDKLEKEKIELKGLKIFYGDRKIGIVADGPEYWVADLVKNIKFHYRLENEQIPLSEQELFY